MRVDPDLTFETLLDRSEVVVIGIDGGGMDDIFGLAAIGREAETKNWLVWGTGWCHTSILERRQTIAPMLQQFADAGELTIVDDRLEDLTEIVDLIQTVHDRGCWPASPSTWRVRTANWSTNFLKWASRRKPA